MTTNWNQEFLQRCQAVSNLTVVCSDGVIFSHKLLAASASDFIKSLLSEVPPHDEVTLYLPDLTKSHVEMWFYSVLNNEKLSEMDISEKLKPDPLVCIGIKKEQEWKDDDEDEDKYNDDEGDADKDMFVPNMFSNEESKTSFSCVSSDKKRRKVKNRKYGREEMKMRYDNAKAEVLSGKSNSSRATARKFDVSEATLRRLLKTDQTYKGKRGCAILTQEEEKSVTERIVEWINDGEDLTISIVRNFLREKIINIKVNEPHREEIFKLCPDVEEFVTPYDFAYTFARRNGLLDLMKKMEEKPVADEVDDNKVDSVEIFSTQISIEELQEEEDELKKELIPNPVSKQDNLVNDRIEKKIKYGKAMIEVLSGKSDSIRATARNFDVSEATLRRLLKGGRTFKGQRGSSLLTRAILTQEEEKSITKRILERTNGGQDLTLGIMQNILIEELNVIKVNEPHREEIPKLCLDEGKSKKAYEFAYCFAKRNKLHALATQRRDEDLELRRNYECDLCEKRYTWKNALTEHRRRVHLL